MYEMLSCTLRVDTEYHGVISRNLWRLSASA